MTDTKIQSSPLRKIIVFLIVFITALFLFLTSYNQQLAISQAINEKQQTTKFLTYENQLGVKMQYPKDWNKDELADLTKISKNPLFEQLYVKPYEEMGITAAIPLILVSFCPKDEANQNTNGSCTRDNPRSEMLGVEVYLGIKENDRSLDKFVQKVTDEIKLAPNGNAADMQITEELHTQPQVNIVESASIGLGVNNMTAHKIQYTLDWGSSQSLASNKDNVIQKRILILTLKDDKVYGIQYFGKFSSKSDIDYPTSPPPMDIQKMIDSFQLTNASNAMSVMNNPSTQKEFGPKPETSSSNSLGSFADKELARLSDEADQLKSDIAFAKFVPGSGRVIELIKSASFLKGEVSALGAGYSILNSAEDALINKIKVSGPSSFSPSEQSFITGWVNNIMADRQKHNNFSSQVLPGFQS